MRPRSHGHLYGHRDSRPTRYRGLGPSEAERVRRRIPVGFNYYPFDGTNDQTERERVTVTFHPEPIYLTGGTGYLGRHLRKRFAEEAWSVTLLLRPGRSADTYPNETIVRGDITDRQTLALDDYRSVVHLAAFTDVETAINDPLRAWRVNADGTANVLEVARNAGVDRFLYASTSRVYGRPAYLPIDESHPTNPLDPYGSSKLAGDRHALAYDTTYGSQVVIARPFNSFGPGQARSNVAAVVLDQVRTADEVRLRTLSPSRDFLYVADIVSGLERILTRGEPGEVYNVGRGEAIPVGKFAELAVEASGRDLPVVAEDSDRRSKSISIPRSVADSTKLRGLGWEPKYSNEEGLRALLDEHDGS